MNNKSLKIITAKHIESITTLYRLDIIEVIKEAYSLHYNQQTVLPFSSFLRPKHDVPNRFIALPGYIGGGLNVCGMKWISSFPGNIKREYARANAIIALNSADTGMPIAILEGSLISKLRTAASAALAVKILLGNDSIDRISLIGCGVINNEILSMLCILYPKLSHIFLHDIDASRLQQFKLNIETRYPQLRVTQCQNLNDALADARLVSFATTASVPYVKDVENTSPDALVLNISLRDIFPECIVQNINVVDDVEHVLREDTSLHLAEKMDGNHKFINFTIGQLLQDPEKLKNFSRGHRIIFSPFGLGVLDIALSKYFYDFALKDGQYYECESFFPL